MTSTLQSVLALAGFVLLSFLGALPGIFFRPGAFFNALEKPSWNPPAFVFGPVWTMLYTAMGVAIWLVWRAGALDRTTALLFGAQLLLNALWTVIFFGLDRPGLAVLDIVLLLALIVIVAFRFHARVPLAGWLFAPYAAWVAFATALNVSIWRLNP